jgi:hypothetical protein
MLHHEPKPRSKEAIVHNNIIILWFKCLIIVAKACKMNVVNVAKLRINLKMPSLIVDFPIST